tara:strand:+ start:696 stop:1139 length:444 start_codon:yes stop_codon:yes gene_type:complete
MNDEQVDHYLKTGSLENIQIDDNATWFEIRPLSMKDREEAEIRAGAFTRSELGKHLSSEAPIDSKERAYWHHNLSDEERLALSQYDNYQTRSCYEYVNQCLISIDGEPASFEMIDKITPALHRTITITQILNHLNRLSVLSDPGKSL